MWDTGAIMLIQEELTEVALTEQSEVAAWARMALEKIKSKPERLAIADKVAAIAVNEANKEEPDYDVFHNGCMLLRDLQCKEHFIKFVEEYKSLIYLAYGLDEKDLEDMKNSF